MSGHSATFTGDNVDEIRDLGVHVIEHPTQPALIVFADEGDLDPVGTALIGQVIEVTDDGVRVIGRPDPDAAPVVIPPAKDELYDPAGDSVEGVLAYLHGLTDSDEDQAEAERVLDAERAGKARKSIVGDGEQ